MRCTRAASAHENSPGSSGPGGVMGGKMWRTAASSAVAHLFSCDVRKTANASRPSGFIALRMLVKVATGSAKNMTPKREKTKSKLLAERCEWKYHKALFLPDARQQRQCAPAPFLRTALTHQRPIHTRLTRHVTPVRARSCHCRSQYR